MKENEELEGPYTIWTIEDMANQFKISVETIRRKVMSGELPQPDIGDIMGRGAKRWVAQGVINYLLKRNNNEEKFERVV